MKRGFASMDFPSASCPSRSNGVPSSNCSVDAPSTQLFMSVAYVGSVSAVIVLSQRKLPLPRELEISPP